MSSITAGETLQRAIRALLISISLLPSAAWARERLPTDNHGLRTLGLSNEEVTELNRALEGELYESRNVMLAGSHPEAVEKCKSDVRCHCAEGRSEGSERAVFGNIGRIGDIYSFELVLIDLQSCQVENSIFASSDGEPLAHLKGVVQKLVTPLESISESATKSESDVDSAPALVTVITAKQIQQLGITSVAELFRLVPGFEVMDANWGDTVLHHGLPNTLLLMVDGVPLYDALNNFRYFPRDFMILLNNIDRVEFVRGPGSVLWGAQAYLGTVNFVMKAGGREVLNLVGQARGGTQKTAEVFASADQRTRLYAFHVSGTLQTTNGPTTVVDDAPISQAPYGPFAWGGNGFTNNQPNRYWDMSLKASLLDRLELDANIINSKRYFEIDPFGNLLNADAPGLWEKQWRILALSWQDKLPLGLRYKIAASRYEYYSWESFVFAPASTVFPAGIRSLQGHQTDPRLAETIEGRLFHDFSGSGWANHLLVSAAYIYQKTPDSLATLTGVYVEPPVQKVSFTSKQFPVPTAFMLDTLSFFDQLHLSGGVRFEHRVPFGPVVSTQGGLIWNRPDYGAKWIYSEGFRTPDAVALYSTVGTEGNTALRPERSRAISLEGHVQPFDWGLLRIEGTFVRIYDLLFRDATAADPGFLYKYVNRNSVQIYTATAEARFTSSLVEAFASYNFKHLDQAVDDKVIPVAPHTASAGLIVLPLRDVRAFATFSYTSPRPILELTSDGGSAMTYVRDALYTTTGVALTNLPYGFNVELKLRNPFGFVHYTPYLLDGNPNPLLERRTDSEVLLTVRWNL
jgi:outer membrane cobalamin receptor